ncbi:hypothetical protein EC973_001722 [Apophysomyces ossiformis]|uniref:BD-FAE-like domain-containing protein n=1 Tax=Apophysomyces ossiformis TaxID=679940 RepID=A0A8H7BJ93_9FUNG|nr:hypothetical protein EC973_001722 [Apophysomyces ossiformis]
MAALIALFVQGENTRLIADAVVRELGGKPVESIISWPHMKLLINPFAKLPVTIHPNIGYATNEESVEAIERTKDYSQPRLMTLDIYTRSDHLHGSLRPVLVHIHGGAWTSGSKDPYYPSESLLVSENDWIAVNINYRLSPANAYPTHLVDIKRALRWIKQSIESFGGDPNFILLEADIAGAQLAVIAALTANQPEFQPGFEDVDTSVQGVICLSGLMDIQSSKENKEYFVNQVVMDPNVEQSFLDKHSPMAAVLEAGRQGKLPPFLTIAGEADFLNDCAVTENFKSVYDKAIKENHGKAECTYVALPGGHHKFYEFWSPRALYAGRIVQAWCQALHRRA